MSKIRVLLTTPHLRSTGSPYRHLAALVQYLPKEEFELTVCSLTSSSDEVALSLLEENQVAHLVYRFRPLGGGIRGRSLGKKWRHILATLEASTAMYRAGQFDVHHSLDYVSHPFEAVLSRLKRIPYLFTQKNLLYGGSQVGLRVKTYLSTRVIAISDATETMLIEMGCSRMKVHRIYNGIDVNAISFDPEVNRENTVLVVGQIVRLKGVEDAIRAFSALALEFPQLQLHVVGPVVQQDYYEELKELTNQLEISERVFFLGRRNDVLERMRKAKLLLHCSRSEALGWVLIEAMSVGLPVISANFSAASEIVQNGKTGFLVQHRDIEAYTQAIRILLTDRERTVDLIKHARLEVERKFSARSMANQTADVYRDVYREAYR